MESIGAVGGIEFEDDAVSSPLSGSSDDGANSWIVLQEDAPPVPGNNAAFWGANDLPPLERQLIFNRRLHRTIQLPNGTVVRRSTRGWAEEQEETSRTSS